MKKVLFGAVMALCVASGAWAQNAAPVRIVYDQVGFRAQVAANPVSQWDSLTTRRVGAAGASSVLDTTVSISTAGWVIHNPVVLADTMSQFCTFVVYDAQGSEDCESGADSLAVAMQVSPDGETWVTSAAIAGQSAAGATAPIVTRNNQTILNGAFMDRLSLNGAALANGKPVWIYRFKIRGAQAFADVAEGSTQFWPFVRFILSFHDAKGYIVQSKVGHYSGVQ